MPVPRRQVTSRVDEASTHPSATRPAVRNAVGHVPSLGEHAAVIAEDVVESILAVLGPFLQAAEHEDARHAELAAVTQHPRLLTQTDQAGNLAARQFRTGLHVDDVGGLVRSCRMPGYSTVRTLAPSTTMHLSYERVVLDHDGHGIRRLEHAANADAAG